MARVCKVQQGYEISPIQSRKLKLADDPFRLLKPFTVKLLCPLIQGLELREPTSAIAMTVPVSPLSFK